MASRKKKTAGSRSSAVSVAHEFSVIVEDIRSQFKVFGEALLGLREQVASGFEEVNRRFEQVDRRFEQVDRRFEQVDRRFEQVDRRFDEVDSRFEQVDREIGLVKTAVIENGRELREIRGAVARLDKKVDRDEVEAIVEGVLARPRAH